MAKNDLSSAINLVSQLPEIKYSEIGTLTNQLETMGYDQKTAKMAIIMVFKENPQVRSLTKSAGVNALQAAKSMFDANMEIGDILDKLLNMGYLKKDAVEAIDALNLDEGDQEVNKFTDISSDEDNAFADYADEGYEYDDIPPKALQAILNQANNNKDEVDEEFVREVLESYDVSANSISQLNRELFAREATVTKKSVELSWRDIGLAMQDSNIDSDQIITILKDNGASEEEAAAAALPREGQEEGEGGPGAMSDAPEDLDMGPGGDLPYGAGMDMEGPGGLNDGLEGAPGPNDFSGTGGGYMGAPDDVSDGDFFADAPSGAGGGEGSGENDSYLEDLARDYIENDPQMTKGDIVEILKNEGADKQEANQVADNLGLEDDSAIKPGVFVRAGVGTGRVVSVWDTMYGKMANVLSDADGKEYEFQVQDIELFENEKNSHFEDELFDKIAKHLDGEWFDSLDNISEDYRDTYSSRIKEARTLQNEINVRLGSSNDIGEMGILEESRDALAHEIVFCQTRLASNEFIGEQEYVNSLPKYEFAKEASLGNNFGPGGGESLVLIADDMDREASSEDWDEILRTESIDFVNNLSTTSIGDAQEVAKIAFDHFSPRVAGIQGERKFEIISEFMSNVEKVRRAVVANIKTSDFDQEDDHMSMIRKQIFYGLLHNKIQRAKEVGMSNPDEAIQAAVLNVKELNPDYENVQTINDLEQIFPGISNFALESFQGEKRLLQLLQEYGAEATETEMTPEHELELIQEDAEHERRMQEDPEYRSQMEELERGWQEQHDRERSPEGKYEDYWDMYNNLDQTGFYNKDEEDDGNPHQSSTNISDEGWLL